ncbi:MAG TPA: glutathione S-transferase family protein [Steroidobacteraceae bacterium]|jgi:glutathione S-transferase|nr:glutathione S-transferase family protein [Steroidobacteraceae bacterium]
MFTIYGVPLSIHVRKVIVTALEKRLEHQVETVFPFDPPPGWRDLSPTGKIPAMKHGDLTLADSSVIVAYLEKRFPELPLSPSDPAQYARALWFEEYVDSQIAPDVIGLFQQKILAPLVHKREPDAAVINRLLNEDLPPKLDYLERSLQGDYLVGGRVSVADITLASDLTIFHYIGCTLDPARYPNLLGHFNRMLKRDSFRKALAAEQPFAEKMGLDRGFLQAA